MAPHLVVLRPGTRRGATLTSAWPQVMAIGLGSLPASPAQRVLRTREPRPLRRRSPRHHGPHRACHPVRPGLAGQTSRRGHRRGPHPQRRARPRLRPASRCVANPEGVLVTPEDRWPTPTNTPPDFPTREESRRDANRLLKRGRPIQNPIDRAPADRLHPVVNRDPIEPPPASTA